MMIGFLHSLAICLIICVQQPFIITLNLEYGVKDVECIDLDGDGYKDVVLLQNVEDTCRKLMTVYWGRSKENGFFSKDEFSQWELEKPFSVVFFVESADKRNCKTVLGNSEELNFYEFNHREKRFDSSLYLHTVFPYDSKEPLVLRGVVYDLDEDNIPEMLIPMPMGVSIVKSADVVSTVKVKTFHQIYVSNSLTLYYHFPIVYPLLKVGESPKPIAVVGEDEMVIAKGNNWSEVKRYPLKKTLGEKWDFGCKVGDVNGDGFPDVLISETEGTVNMKTIVKMYISKAPYEYTFVPQFEYKIKGAMSLSLIKDVDGDKQDDLILFNIPLGLTNFINFFLRRKISVDALVFLFSKGGIPTQPSYESSVTMDAPEGRDQVAYAVADFSGDDILDIAYGVSENILAVNCGSKEAFLKTKPCLRLELPSFGMIRTVDVNNNKCVDMILYHPTGKFKNRVDVIIF